MLLTDDGRRYWASPVSSFSGGAIPGCWICHKSNHEIKGCFLNPLNVENWLNLRTEVVERMNRKGSNGQKRKKKMKGGGRSAVARAITVNQQAGGATDA